VVVSGAFVVVTVVVTASVAASVTASAAADVTGSETAAEVDVSGTSVAGAVAVSLLLDFVVTAGSVDTSISVSVTEAASVETSSDEEVDAAAFSEEALLPEEPPLLQAVRRSADIIIAGISLFILISFGSDAYIIPQPALKINSSFSSVGNAFPCTLKLLDFTIAAWIYHAGFVTKAEYKIIFSIFNGFALKNASFLPISERRYRSGRKEVIFIQEKDNKKLRDDFCCYYALLGNAEEAAAKAGFPGESALREGIGCLRSAGCRRKIAELRELMTSGSEVITGLKRLAFGSCKDAAVLAFADELPPPEVIGRLDLFNVSEIKRVKGGGVEVKLFDRLKALEKLFELENTFSDRDKAAGLMNALLAGGEEAEETEDQ